MNIHGMGMGLMDIYVYGHVLAFSHAESWIALSVGVQGLAKDMMEQDG